MRFDHTKTNSNKNIVIFESFVNFYKKDFAFLISFYPNFFTSPSEARLKKMNDDDNQVICPCPVCGEELAHLDEMWRSIHVNGCLSKNDPSLNQRCEIEKCPFCKKRLNHLSATLANAHINECMDKSISEKASKRKNERCPICGQSIKNLTERQRKLQEQTCMKADRVQEVDVYQYPKVVESLPTPEEWETETIFHPQFVSSKPLQSLNDSHVPIFGEIYQTIEIQGITDFNFDNSNLTLQLPPNFNLPSEF